MKTNTKKTVVAVADKTLARVEKKDASIQKYDPTQLTEALKGFSREVANISKKSAPGLWDSVKRMKDLVEEYEKSVRQFVLNMVDEDGKKATDAGTKRLSAGGYQLEIQPSGGGYDSKKVESLLNAKGVSPLLGMDAVITYKVNEGKLVDLMAKKKLTADELDTCRDAKDWKVMSPKKEE